MARKPGKYGAPWTVKDRSLLRRLVREGTPTRTIARRLGRTEGALYQYASQQGIALSESPHRRRRRAG